jgi:hypothetical protein
VPVMGSCCPIFRAGDWNLAPRLGRNRRVQAAFFEGSLLTLAPAGGRPLPKLLLTSRGLRGSRSFSYWHVVLVRGPGSGAAGGEGLPRVRVTGTYSESKCA